MNESRRGELGLEAYGSSLGWMARDKAQEWGEVGSSISVGMKSGVGFGRELDRN